MGEDARRDEVRISSPETPRQTGKKKNTARWCRGKAGREHTWELKEGREAGFHRDSCITMAAWWMVPQKGHRAVQLELSVTRVICAEAYVCAGCGKRRPLGLFNNPIECRLAGSHDKDGLPHPRR